MRQIMPILLTSAFVSFAGGPAVAAVSIGPLPHSDRLFPYVIEGPTFRGIPLEVSHARLPGAVVVFGAKDGPRSAANAGTLAFMLGQLAQTPAIGASAITSRRFSPMVTSDAELPADIKTGRHLIVLGIRNSLIAELSPKLPRGFGAAGPALHVIPDAFAPGQVVMVLTGPDEQALQEVADYLAYDRLLHRSGAYDGLFAFVRLRTYLERRNFRAAADLIDDLQQLRACAKSVTVMMPRMAQMPAGVPEVSMKRNNLVFKQMREAIAREDQAGAVSTWKQTMQTCYVCHAGRGGTQVVMFKPASYPHRLHQGIATGAGLECTSCHQGPTESLGYSD